MNLKSKEFKKLRTEWYKILKKSGFKDIERNDYELKEPTKLEPITIEESRAYYRLARQFLENHDFDSEFDAALWYMHSRGVSARDIGKMIKRSNSTVSAVIAKYEARMLRR
jgi:hypothetical protein